MSTAGTRIFANATLLLPSVIPMIANMSSEPTLASDLVNVTMAAADRTRLLVSAIRNATAIPKPPSCVNCLPLYITTLFAILFAMIIIIGILGNAFVVGVIITDRKLLNSSVNLFLLNLALADLGNLVFCAPDVLQVLLDKGWLLPGMFCPLLRFLQEYFLYASVLLQMSIGIERYMAICSPLRMQRFSRRTTAYVLVGVWATAAAFATPYFVFQGILQYKFYFCFWKSIRAPTKLLFKYAEFTILYAVPLVLLTVLYAVMGRVLWGKSGTIANEAQQMAILRLRRSVVKMLIISMILYFICYSPIQAVFITETFFRKQVHMESWLRILLNALSVSSSSANPIVYIMCCRHFHSRFVALVAWFGSIISPAEPYATVVETEKSHASRTLSRSPYVSFRKSLRRHHTHTVTLL